MARKNKPAKDISPQQRLKHLQSHRNRLLRILKIQEIYQEHKVHEGIRDTWIYKEKIYPLYFIAKSTFMKYLSMNAKRELHQLLERIENLKVQCKEHSESKTS